MTILLPHSQAVFVFLERATLARGDNLTNGQDEKHVTCNPSPGGGLSHNDGMPSHCANRTWVNGASVGLRNRP